LLNETEVYPNPSHGEFIVQVKTTIKENAELSISTIEGRVMYQRQVLTNERVPIFAELPGGVYVLSVSTSHQHFIDKLVIQ